MPRDGLPESPIGARRGPVPDSRPRRRLLRRAGRPMSRISRRALLAAGTSAAASVALKLPTGATRQAAASGVLDDASRLNPTPVARHWRPAQVTGAAWLDALRAELKTAAAQSRPVAVGAARHSMGGQAL